MTCILITLYGFPCNEKQKKPEHGILTTLPFSVTKLKKKNPAFPEMVNL